MRFVYQVVTPQQRLKYAKDIKKKEKHIKNAQKAMKYAINEMKRANSSSSSHVKNSRNR